MLKTPKAKRVFFATFILLVFATVGYIFWTIPKRVFDARSLKAADRAKNWTLPTVADFISSEMFRNSRVVFRTPPVVMYPEKGIAPCLAFVIESDLDRALGDKTSVGSEMHLVLAKVQISMFHDDITREPRSIKMVFEISRAYDPSKDDSEWADLIGHARNGEIHETTWNGLEVAISKNRSGELQLILRGPWPLPYWYASSNHFHERVGSQDPVAIRKGAIIVSRALGNAEPAFDYQWGLSGAWVVLRDGRSLQILTDVREGVARSTVAPFNQLDEDVANKLQAGFKERMGIDYKGEFSFPAEMNMSKFSDDWYRRGSKRATIAAGIKSDPR